MSVSFIFIIPLCCEFKKFITLFSQVRRLTTKSKQTVKPIFSQISRQVVKMKPADLRLPSRAWKVKLLGEGADDAGGVFDDTITGKILHLAGASLHKLFDFWQRDSLSWLYIF